MSNIGVSSFVYHMTSTNAISRQVGRPNNQGSNSREFKQELLFLYQEQDLVQSIAHNQVIARLALVKDGES
jgi:hypothetical protein